LGIVDCSLWSKRNWISWWWRLNCPKALNSPNQQEVI
jgi:hypothetical protein